MTCCCPRAHRQFAAACRDIAQRLDEWQGPGIVVVCGRLVAPGSANEPAVVVERHAALTDALETFAARADSQVIVVLAPSERDAALVQALERHGATVRESVDLRCETGAGTRTVLVRAGTLRPDSNPPMDAAPSDDRPWLAGMERLDDPRLGAPLRHLARPLPPPAPLPLGPAAGPGRDRALLRVEFIVDGLGRVFRTPRQQTALQPRLQRHLAFALHRDDRDRRLPPRNPRPRGRADVARHLAGARWRGTARPWAGGPSGTRPIAHEQLLLDDEDALDATRAAVEAGVSGVIVGGALVPELTHLHTGFFACPGATSEIVHEHRGRLGLPPTFLHHRQESTLEIETGAELHVRLLLAEADLPLATMGERLVTADTVVKGRSKAADVHAELAASWPGGASWPPAPEVAADHIRVRRIRRLAAVLLFVAGAIDLLSSVTTPLREHLHLIAQYLPVAVVQAAGALTAIAGIGMIMLSRACCGVSAAPGSSPCCCSSPRSPSTCCTRPTSSRSSSAPVSSRC